MSVVSNIDHANLANSNVIQGQPSTQISQDKTPWGWDEKGPVYESDRTVDSKAIATSPSKIPLKDRILTFDVDGTVGIRVAKDKIDIAKKNGYEVHKLPPINGYEDEFPYYAIRPGALDLIKDLKQQGFIIVFSSRNFKEHMMPILDATGLTPFADHIYERKDIETSPESQDFETYPNHSNNVGKLRRFIDWTKFLTYGWMVDSCRYIKHVATRNKTMFYSKYKPSYANKYPAQWGSRILFDDKEENDKNALRSRTWIYGKVIHGTPDKPEAKDAAGNYLWTKGVYKMTNSLKAKGWEATFEDKYNKKPIKKQIKLIESAKHMFANLNLNPEEAKVST